VNVVGFEFPDELHYHVEHQTWARAESDGSVTVGITSMGIGLSGEIYMCRPKPVGQFVEQGRSVAVVELAKAIVSVRSPLSGTVVQVNEALSTQPELVHLDPYGQGWIARLAASSWEADAQALVHGELVRQAMAHHAHLNQLST
jgi:glycine cleavage system H protein